MNENLAEFPVWAWWRNGECVVKILKRGHYPTSIMVQLPSDKVTEIEIAELELNRK